MATRKVGPAEAELLADLEAGHLADSGVLVQLALALARRVDARRFTAADAQQLRLTWAAIVAEGRPARPGVVPDDGDGDEGGDTAKAVGETSLERARRRREEAARGGSTGGT